MSDVHGSQFEFPQIAPATTLDEVWEIFDPTLAIDPSSAFYIPRTDPKLQKLSWDLKKCKTDLHAFLCGHRGGGKTTELNRICQDREILNKFFTVFLTAQDFGSEVVHLTHDALLVEIGLALIEHGELAVRNPRMVEEFNQWGTQVVTSFVKDESIKAEVGAKANAWLAFFKAQLGMRRE